MWTQWGEAGMDWEIRIDIYTLSRVRWLVGNGCVAQAGKLGAL